MAMAMLLSMLTRHIIHSQHMFILPTAAIAIIVSQRVTMFLWVWDLVLVATQPDLLYRHNMARVPNVHLCCKKHVFSLLESLITSLYVSCEDSNTPLFSIFYAKIKCHVSYQLFLEYIFLLVEFSLLNDRQNVTEMVVHDVFWLRYPSIH